jgi:hypothetical protein
MMGRGGRDVESDARLGVVLELVVPAVDGSDRRDSPAWLSRLHRGGTYSYDANGNLACLAAWLPYSQAKARLSVTATRAIHQLLAASPASPECSVVTRLDQAGLVGEDDGLGPVAEAEFGKQVGEVRLYRRFTEEQRAGDLLV